MDGFKVCSGKCDECLFSAQKIVPDNRRREIIQSCLRENSFFVCHKATLIGESVCCKGFYDTYGPQINLIRIAERLRVVREVDVEELSEKARTKSSNLNK